MAAMTAVIVSTLACSGGSQVPPLAPVPEPVTKATLAGPLCELNVCRCREDAGDPPQSAPAGFKRYEVRLGPSDNALWATVDDMVFYKTNEHAIECFYIDLRPGRHSVRLRASRETGLGARLDISERAPNDQGWYDTVKLGCGSPGTCSRDEMRAWMHEMASAPGQVLDPCGSTKIRQVSYQTGRLPDNVPPGDLQVDFTLDIYKFVPKSGPDSPECAKKREKHAAEAAPSAG